MNALLDAFLAEDDGPAAAEKKSKKIVKSDDFDLVAWIAEHVPAELRLEPKEESDHTTWALRCPWSPLEGQKDHPAWITKFNDSAISGGCHHGSCADRGWTEIREAFEPLPDVDEKVMRALNAATSGVDDFSSGVNRAVKAVGAVRGVEVPQLVACLLDRSCVLSAAVLFEEDGDWEHVVVGEFWWPEAFVLLERPRPRGMAEWIVARARENAAPDGRTWVQSEEGKIIPSSYANVSLALDLLEVRLSYDEFADKYLVSGVEGFGPQLDDAATVRLHIMVQDRFGFMTPWPQFCKAVEDKCLAKKFHPVRAYLDGLKWDGVPRVDDWLSYYCGAKYDGDNPEAAEKYMAYVSAVGSIFLIAAVRRVRQPGCQYGRMLILEGKQGRGKSSLLRALCHLPEWFTDQVPLWGNSREMVEATRGKLLIECAELAGMSKSEIGHLKANLTRQEERCRISYARRTVDVSRQFVIVGSTNDDRYLEDSTGNIRFQPVLTHGELKVEEMKTGRDQLWAEAAVREARGESIELAEGIWDAATEQQEARETIDPWEEKLSEDLPAAGARVLSEDLYIFLGLDVLKDRDKRAGLRLGRIMRRLGWEYVNLKSNKVQRKCWAKGAAGKGSLVTLVADVRADGKVRSLVAAGGEAAF